MHFKMHFKRQKAHSRGKKKNATKKPKDIQQLCLLPRNATALINHPLLQVLCGLWKTLQGCFILGSLILDASLPNQTNFCQEHFCHKFP